MHTRPNWLKIIGLLSIGIVVATAIRVSGLMLLTNAASYVLSFIAMALFIYLALSANLPQLMRFMRENRGITTVIAADFIIRTVATAIVFPDILPSLSLYIAEEIPLIGLLIHTLGFFIGVLIEFAMIILLYYFSYRICVERNRNALKGVVATFIGFPFTPLILWLALKTRDPKTRQLS